MYTSLISPSRSVLCLALDPTNGPIVVGTVQSDNEDFEIAGGPRQLAGNRTQLATYSSTARTYPITLRMVEPSDTLKLESWAGQFLLLRTTDGKRLFGGFFGFTSKRMLNVAGSLTGTAYDIALSFIEATYNESV